MTDRIYTDTVGEDELAPRRASPLPPARRVLVLAPHPDDEVYGCGGTLHLMAQAGADITVVVASDGALGGPDAERGSEALIAAREAESRAAAAVLGCAPPSFWRLPDRSLRYGESLIARIRETVQHTGAEWVFVPALSELHPDHQALALAAAEALRQLGGQRSVAFYEVSAPLLPNTLIDITAAEERKREAMRCFGTQEAERPYAECVAALNRYRSYPLGHGVRAAEAFFVATPAELALGPARLFETAMGRRRRIGAALDGADIPLVSVVVLTTGAPELQDALASIAAQTYSNLEVVVVDRVTGADRAVPDFGGRFSVQRLTAAVPLDRAGAANAGLGAAKGNYLMLLDEDNVLLPDHVAKRAEALRDGADSAAHSGMRIIGTDGSGLPRPAVLFHRALLDAGSRLDEQRQTLDRGNAELAQRIAALTQANAALIERNAGLASEAAAVREALNAVRSSTSWQLTAPLRWLAGLWRR